MTVRFYKPGEVKANQPGVWNAQAVMTGAK
jgi:hypothetical protein